MRGYPWRRHIEDLETVVRLLKSAESSHVAVCIDDPDSDCLKTAESEDDAKRFSDIVRSSEINEDRLFEAKNMIHTILKRACRMRHTKEYRHSIMRSGIGNPERSLKELIRSKRVKSWYVKEIKHLSSILEKLDEEK